MWQFALLYFFVLFFVLFAIKLVLFAVKNSGEHHEACLFLYFCKMNILIIGNGGREHALAWKIKQSPLCHSIYIAAGNGGTAGVARNLPIRADDFKGIEQCCREKNIDLAVIGPEAPLVEGLRDYLESALKIKIVGPGKKGAQLEGSKDFSKQFMERHHIPTAAYKTFYDHEWKEADDYLQKSKMPIVLKADGPAAGKGVIIAQTKEEAQKAVRDILVEKKFGQAGTKVLIEEFLSGIELSVFVLTDGKNYVILPEAKDYKRIGENDTGLNTGGMGSVSPVPFATPDFMEKVEKRIVQPVMNGLQKEKTDYKGFLFIGLMKVNDDPYVIEFNVRMGDPETQSVMMRLENDLVELLDAAATGTLHLQKIKHNPQTALTVVMAAGGYPEEYEKGKIITGLQNISEVVIFHAGTQELNGTLVTSGGRVLAATALAPSIEAARKKVYEAVDRVKWEGVCYRRDIGLDLLPLETNEN